MKHLLTKRQRLMVVRLKRGIKSCTRDLNDPATPPDEVEGCKEFLADSENDLNEIARMKAIYNLLRDRLEDMEAEHFEGLDDHGNLIHEEDEDDDEDEDEDDEADISPAARQMLAKAKERHRKECERLAQAGREGCYLVRCECGREGLVLGSDLESGAATGCGCHGESTEAFLWLEPVPAATTTHASAADSSKPSPGSALGFRDAGPPH